MKAMISESTDQLRQQVVTAVRSHKASWIQLGQYLYTVHKDKHFKSWGFLTFEAYCMKELGIKQTTAAKLLKSYYFLEKEEPTLARLSQEAGEERPPRTIPDYESVNLLRLAKENQSITPREFSQIRESVLEDAKDAKEVKAQVKRLLEEKKEEDTPEERDQKRQSKIRRLVSLLKSASTDFASEHLLPDYLQKQIQALISKLEDQVRG